MTPERIAELRRMLDEATPGPWKAGRADMVSFHIDGGPPFKNVYGPHHHLHHVTGDPVFDEVAQGIGEKCIEDAHLIAAAINALAPLLDEVERLRAERDNWRNAVSQENAKAVKALREGTALRARVAELTARDGMAQAREAARLGYCAGHDDTVEGRYGDPGEMADEICTDLIAEAARALEGKSDDSSA